jgi:hypothetical protein
MRVENLRLQHRGDRARLAATVYWEDCDRPTQDIYFETAAEFADALACTAHPFLVAATIPAFRHGERRIAVDGSICPELRMGLMTVMDWVRYWYKRDRPSLDIEAKVSAISHPLAPSPRTGWFFSGGIDSLSTLRANRLNYPNEHPGSIKDGLTIYGISSGGSEVETSEQYLDAFDRMVSRLSYISKDAGVNLIPVYTNVRQLDADSYFWGNEFQGAVLSSVAHAFARRLTVASISSGANMGNLHPHGSHPLIDPNYSCQQLRIKHEGVNLSRLAKTKLIADWDVALQNLKVCTKPDRNKSDTLNCGRCEKCIRTMMALLVLGKLDKTNIFPEVDLSETFLVNMVYPKSPYLLECYRELMPLLEAQGRPDLVRAIERITARYHETDFAGSIKKAIRRYVRKDKTESEQLTGSYS